MLVFVAMETQYILALACEKQNRLDIHTTLTKHFLFKLSVLKYLFAVLFITSKYQAQTVIFKAIATFDSRVSLDPAPLFCVF